MALTSTNTFDYEIVGTYRHLNVKAITTYYDDGREVGSGTHRISFGPNTPLDLLPSDEARALIEGVWTPELITAYEAHLASFAPQEVVDDAGS